MVFGNDDEQRHTNQVIYLIDFLREMKGILIYDPEQKNCVELLRCLQFSTARQ